MGKLTFADVVGKEYISYSVAISGAIRSHKVKARNDFDGIDMNSSTLHLTKDGNIDKGWGYASFLNAEDAAELATRIVTRKYNNAIKHIKEVTNT